MQKILKPSLKLIDLIFLGIGSIVGVGVFVVTGITAATLSGPAVAFSFIAAGIATTFTALAYAELASSVNSFGGGAYHYASTCLGRSFGWIIGWTILMEYSVAAAYLGMAWSGYLNSILSAIGIHLPKALLHSYADGGLVDIPAVCIILYLCFLLYFGTRKGSRFNLFLVSIKLLTIFSFLFVAIQHVEITNWQPFLPFGWTGVMQGAALVFNAFVGFDVLASAAGDAENPKRNIPISIAVTIAVSTVLYVGVGLLLTGIAPYWTLNSAVAIIDALKRLHLNWIALLIGTGAILSITTVLFAFLFGLTRIVYALSQDSFLPSQLKQIHHKNNTPHISVLFSGFLIAFLIELIPLHETIKLINLGALFVYSVVCFTAARMRYLYPNKNPVFKLPFNPLFPVLGILTCGYLMSQLPLHTWISFGIWLCLGVFIDVVFHKGRAKKQM